MRQNYKKIKKIYIRKLKQRCISENNYFLLLSDEYISKNLYYSIRAGQCGEILFNFKGNVTSGTKFKPKAFNFSKVLQRVTARHGVVPFEVIYLKINLKSQLKYFVCKSKILTCTQITFIQCVVCKENTSLKYHKLL